MKFPKISGLPDIKSTLSETNPVFSNSLPLAKQYELRKRFSYLDPVFNQLYFNQEQHRLLNSHYFGYELYGSRLFTPGVSMVTQNMGSVADWYITLNKQRTIRIGGNAYQYRSNEADFNDFTLNADLTYRLNYWLTAYVIRTIQAKLQLPTPAYKVSLYLHNLITALCSV